MDRACCCNPERKAAHPPIAAMRWARNSHIPPPYQTKGGFFSSAMCRRRGLPTSREPFRGLSGVLVCLKPQNKDSICRTVFDCTSNVKLLQLHDMERAKSGGRKRPLLQQFSRRDAQAFVCGCRVATRPFAAFLPPPPRKSGSPLPATTGPAIGAAAAQHRCLGDGAFGSIPLLRLPSWPLPNPEAIVASGRTSSLSWASSSSPVRVHHRHRHVRAPRDPELS